MYAPQTLKSGSKFDFSSSFAEKSLNFENIVTRQALIIIIWMITFLLPEYIFSISVSCKVSPYGYI